MGLCKVKNATQYKLTANAFRQMKYENLKGLASLSLKSMPNIFFFQVLLSFHALPLGASYWQKTKLLKGVTIHKPTSLLCKKTLKRVIPGNPC
jgi:hypothetical protein